MKLTAKLEKERLTHQFLTEGKTILQISKDCGKSPRSITAKLRRYGISKVKATNSLDGAILIQRYVVEAKSAKDIGAEFGISKTTVLFKLREIGVQIRPNSRLGRKNKLPYPDKKQIHKDDQFDHLVAIERIEGLEKEVWRCQCSCGGSISVSTTNLLKHRVKSCGCLRKKSHQGYEGISSNCLFRYSYGAQSRGIEFSVNAKDLWELFERQTGRCAISGIAISFGPKGKITASLDRIDSTKGYKIGNIQWVHKIINIMKWQLSSEEFVQWCRIVTENSIVKGNT